MLCSRQFIAIVTLLVLSGTYTQALERRSSTPFDPLEEVVIAAPDGSAFAHFITLGAALTNFYVPDKFGKFRDVILGYDNRTNYLTLGPQGSWHPYFGPVVGRYANRIKNGTFTIDGQTFHVAENENNGKDTLHGGFNGTDLRTWTISEQSTNSVTFTLIDPNGMEGFPGTMHATVTYTLEKHSTWKIAMQATADKKTPIMLSGHHYWNLEAYQESSDLIGHHAQFPASRVIATDGILIPNGKFLNVSNTPLDFRKAKSIGEAINATSPALGYCGTGCVGFDNCWIYDKNTGKAPVFSMWSVNSGIRFDVTTNQPALQMYTCDGIFNATLPIPRKASQGGSSESYINHSCVVIEQEGWIDAINQPEWGVDQIYGDGRKFNWEATYAFSAMH